MTVLLGQTRGLTIIRLSFPPLKNRRCGPTWRRAAVRENGKTRRFRGCRGQIVPFAKQLVVISGQSLLVKNPIRRSTRRDCLAGLLFVFKPRSTLGVMILILVLMRRTRLPSVHAKSLTLLLLFIGLKVHVGRVIVPGFWRMSYEDLSVVVVAGVVAPGSGGWGVGGARFVARSVDSLS